MTDIKAAEPRFALGELAMTQAFLTALAESGDNCQQYLERHRQLERGVLSDDDHQTNQDSLGDGSRIFSAFLLSTGVKIWIITEAINDMGKRWSTTMILPSDY